MASRKKGIDVGLDIGEDYKDPGEFRDLVILSEKLGFDVAWLGDHFMPWMHSGNRSAFVWSLLGSCLEATKSIRLGPYVTTPIGGRYHPAMIAQASATLDNMYPGRFVLGVGTGEAMNEVPFMPAWPPWKERIGRLVEGVQLIKKMWSSDLYFDFDGEYFKAHEVFLYTKPRTGIKILMASVGKRSAELAGKHGDGIITLGSRNPPDKIRDVVFSGFEKGAREANKDPRSMERVVTLSFTFDSPEKYLRRRRASSGNLAVGALDEPDPRKVEQMSHTVTDDALLGSVVFCSGWSEVAELVWKFKDMGVTQVVLPSGPDDGAIRTYAERLLPLLRE